MVYLGSKIHIAKYIIPIIQNLIDYYNVETYVEPFVGGCNVIDKIHAPIRIGNDKNKYLIEMFRNLDKLDSFPLDLSKEEYDVCKRCAKNDDGNREAWYIGAVGSLYSYFGKIWGGYCLKARDDRNYVSEHYKNLLSQKENLLTVDFKCEDYRNLNIPNGSVVYCDPPYRDTYKYFGMEDFDSDDFWEWVRIISKDNYVITSEVVAPDDFKAIWQKTDNRGKFKDRNEKLFAYRGGLYVP